MYNVAIRNETNYTWEVFCNVCGVDLGTFSSDELLGEMLNPTNVVTGIRCDDCRSNSCVKCGRHAPSQLPVCAMCELVEIDGDIVRLSSSPYFPAYKDERGNGWNDGE